MARGTYALDAASDMASGSLVMAPRRTPSNADCAIGVLGFFQRNRREAIYVGAVAGSRLFGFGSELSL